jgi:RNA polymerase sigma-70 factor, ECF subfamily
MAIPARIDPSKCGTDPAGDRLRANRSADLTLCIVSSRPTPEQFEQLAMPLFDSLYNFAVWLTESQEEAEDLVQETYLKGLKGFSSFEAGTNFRAWIFRILRNTFLTSRTGLQAMRMVPLDDTDDPTTDGIGAVTETPETVLLNRASNQAVQTAIEQLPVIFREVLLLCDVEEMSYQEIAETVAIPVGTVMSRLHRARRGLRQALQDPKGKS